MPATLLYRPARPSIADRIAKTSLWGLERRQGRADGAIFKYPGASRCERPVPENTLEGFLGAFALGITAFELDAGMTADDVMVVSHDPALHADLTRDASGRWLPQPGPTIRSLTPAALRAFGVGRLRPGSPTAAMFLHQMPHDGARIPTLASVLAALPTTRFTIEVKTNPAHPDWTAGPQHLADATMAVVGAAGRMTRS